MAEGAAQLDDGLPSSDQRLARGIAVGLPLVTLSVAAVVGVLVGPAPSILVLAAGVLLGVIALLWGSLRILSGDAELPPELEALDMSARGVDALASRKTMLLRAIKDLDTERGLGKLEDDDYEQISLSYRNELKTVLQRIDASLAPHRAAAEDAVRAHLVETGVLARGYRGDPAPSSGRPTPPGRDEAPSETEEAPVAEGARGRSGAEREARLACSACGASNEIDAKFCKECAAKLSGTGQGSDGDVGADGDGAAEEASDAE